MSQYLSKERVVRDDVLVYAVSTPIPPEDTEELRRQGYLEDKGRKAGANKAEKPGANK